MKSKGWFVYSGIVICCVLGIICATCLGKYNNKKVVPQEKKVKTEKINK